MHSYQFFNLHLQRLNSEISFQELVFECVSLALFALNESRLIHNKPPDDLLLLVDRLLLVFQQSIAVQEILLELGLGFHQVIFFPGHL